MLARLAVGFYVENVMISQWGGYDIGMGLLSRKGKFFVLNLSVDSLT